MSYIPPYYPGLHVRYGVPSATRTDPEGSKPVALSILSEPKPKEPKGSFNVTIPVLVAVMAAAYFVI